MDGIKGYEDIINLPNPSPTGRARMSRIDRAAQFAPFAALTGYEAAVAETARLTDKRVELTDDVKEMLNEKIRMICENLDAEPSVTITYFVPDRKKDGGAYVDISGSVRRVDEYERTILMVDGNVIPIEEIAEISGDMFGAVI